jgi:hypothetical protein
MRAVLSPGPSAFILTLPIEQPLGFVLYIAEKTDGPRAVLLVNKAVASREHPYRRHPVIHWLRKLTRPDDTAKAEGRVVSGRPPEANAPPRPPPTLQITIGAPDFPGDARGALGEMKDHPGYPLLVGGSQMYTKKTFSFTGGDFRTTPDGDFATVGGVDALAQYVEHAIRKARPSNGHEAEAALRAFVQDTSYRDHFAEIRAFRSDDHAAEVDFVAVGYPLRTQRVVFRPFPAQRVAQGG